MKSVMMSSARIEAGGIDLVLTSVTNELKPLIRTMAVGLAPGDCIGITVAVLPEEKMEAIIKEQEDDERKRIEGLKGAGEGTEEQADSPAPEDVQANADGDGESGSDKVDAPADGSGEMGEKDENGEQADTASGEEAADPSGDTDLDLEEDDDLLPDVEEDEER
jgi:hypothetical protein